MIEFRFPGGRWERCPFQDAVQALMILGYHYDLRIDGRVHLAAGSSEAAQG